MMAVEPISNKLKSMKKPLKEWAEYCRIYDTIAQNEQKTGRIDHEGRKQLRIARKTLLDTSRNNPDSSKKSTRGRKNRNQEPSQ